MNLVLSKVQAKTWIYINNKLKGGDLQIGFL